ncbi:hypothetical protein NSK_007471 [Nannochloropsis salina CCMP1776]|uniref:ABC1 atypical kinase-like domain-containing protein n=1 Tax=Nannochloropsis salina CCMP1776 TaxID=1027361 RepID=A0A4D9CRM7_9STRA|nr:hypothetical protein NSK_007471 [Nannochloropsis salina CCMP1776]|eukprot:TFJ81204.1 hypothetical protein NSK_007471 [Nannochloropsis salina CCMP1776]
MRGRLIPPYRLMSTTLHNPSVSDPKSVPTPPSTSIPDYNHRDALTSRDGLPLVYEPKTIKKYWDARPAEMQRRWALFLSVTAPFLTKLGKRPGNARVWEETDLEEGKTTHVRGRRRMEEEGEDVFLEVSPEPVAAASLAQVYKARLKSNGEWVAVKVQRPDMLATVSKDLYVIRRAVEVYQKYIVERFTAQKTDYQELLQSEWIDGIKLTQASQDDVRRLTKVAQECFLRQLLEFGVFHADPHPGNLLLMSDKSKGELAILDWLVDDLIDLKVLPASTDRAQVLPVMQRVIGPYVFQGGGAKNLNLQSLSRDLTKGFTQGTLFDKEAELARDLRIVLEKLGPTFVKLGQALSIRPDVIGPAATEELQKLQDAVPPFSNDVAFAILEGELGCPWQFRRTAALLPRPFPFLPPVLPPSLVDELAPPLSLEEEVFLGSVAELGATLVGEEGMSVLEGQANWGGLPRPDRVVAWLTSVNAEDLLDVARLLQPGTSSSKNIVDFASEVVRGLLTERAIPRVRKAAAGLGGMDTRMSSSVERNGMGRKREEGDGRRKMEGKGGAQAPEEMERGRPTGL